MSAGHVVPAVFEPAPLEDLVLQLDAGTDALRGHMARMVLAPPTPDTVAVVRRVIAGLDQIAGQLAAAVRGSDEPT